MNSAGALAVVVALAVIAWPRRRAPGEAMVAHEPRLPSGGPMAWFAAVDEWRARRAKNSTKGVEAELLGVVEALAGALEAGLAPGPALALAADGVTGELGEALAGVERRARMGDGLAAGWLEAARRLDNAELGLLGRAWSLSEETGTPLADAARTAARVLRDQRDQRDRTRTAVTGAQATMTLLTVLPAAGPLLGMFMGVDVLHVYATSPIVWAALGAGVVLVLIGRVWVQRLITHTLAGEVLR